MRMISLIKILLLQLSNNIELEPGFKLTFNQAYNINRMRLAAIRILFL
jgi:hypothetical protein